MDPTMTTGFPQLTVASMKNAVSSNVSVPWVITAPLMVSSLQITSLICFERSRRMLEVTSSLPTLEICTPATLETLRTSGTASRRVKIPTAPAVYPVVAVLLLLEPAIVPPVLS